ncbi:hypothetical protein DXB41_16075 [Segatella copri]|nr:hypothetical protein DXB41_16075 [Segatella copri]
MELYCHRGWMLTMILGIHNITKWFGWFILGMILATYQAELKKVISKYHLELPLLVHFYFNFILTLWNMVIKHGILCFVWQVY